MGLKINVLFLLLNLSPLGYLCASPEDFESSRVPIKDWKGLIDVLRARNDNPVAKLTTPQVIEKYGYPSESHKVITKDGYILTMHRIPYGKNDKTTAINYNRNSTTRKPVVFLQHGLFASSFEWLMNTPDKLLALQLADAGYDVWFGNARGNRYSRQHKTLTVKDPNFWEFSVNEMGKYDLPAEIDYVLAKTKQKQLKYIGFSMGTTMFWTLMSHHPSYNSKVKFMIALAPVAYLNNMAGFTRFIAPIPGTEKPVKTYLDLLSGFRGEFLPPWYDRIYKTLGSKFCVNKYIAETICSNLVFLFAGYDLPQSQINQLPIFFTHTPSSTSVRTVVHLAQFINTGTFRQYNFGRRENLKRYGSVTPPDYNLKNVQVPVALINGPNDAVVSPIDVNKLVKLLPNVVAHMPVNNSLWNHFDYHLGKDANEFVNQHVLKLLSMY